MGRYLQSFGVRVGAGVGATAVAVGLLLGSGSHLPDAPRPTYPPTPQRAEMVLDLPLPPLEAAASAFPADADASCDQQPRPVACDVAALPQIGPYALVPLDHLDGALTRSEARERMDVPGPRPHTAVQGFLVRATLDRPDVADRPAWLFVAIGPCDLVGFRASGGPHGAPAPPPPSASATCMEGYLGDAMTGEQLLAASGAAIPALPEVQG